MSPFLRAQLDGPLPITAPLVLNPLMARMVEAAGFPAGRGERPGRFDPSPSFYGGGAATATSGSV